MAGVDLRDRTWGYRDESAMFPEYIGLIADLDGEMLTVMKFAHADGSARAEGFLLGERARAKFGELFGGPERAGASLGIEKPDHPLHLRGFRWKRTARPFAGRVLHVPARRYKTEESMPAAKRRLDREMGQIVQREMRGVTRLLLPRDGAVVPRTAEDSAAVGLFGDFNSEH